jgi:hypothetical protein
MNAKLFDILEQTDGMSMPLYRDRGGVNKLRHPTRSKAAEFPADYEQRPRRRQPQAQEHK